MLIPDEAQLRACLLLHSIPELNDKALLALLNRSPALTMLSAPESHWLDAGLTPVQLAALAFARETGVARQPKFDVERALVVVQRLGVHILEPCSDDYPPLLSVIPDPPPLLYVRGDPATLALSQVAMVGSRSSSPAGRKVAHQLAEQLSYSGVVVTSGLALGIDGQCHRGAIAAGGRTIAAMASGIDTIYPRRHEALAQDIVAHGALVTEFAPGTAPMRHHFPRRNRIISGLSLATVVVEAALPSGSLLTASSAAAQGRDVCAVPWSVLHAGGAGCLQLLKDGATLVRDAQDVLDGLGWFSDLAAPVPEQNSGCHPEALDAKARHLFDHLSECAVSSEQLAADTGLSASELQALATQLELEGFLVRSHGGLARA